MTERELKLKRFIDKYKLSHDLASELLDEIWAYEMTAKISVSNKIAKRFENQIEIIKLEHQLEIVRLKNEYALKRN
jgi:hypothetical protein